MCDDVVELSREEESADEFFLKGYNENFGFWMLLGGVHKGNSGIRWIGETFIIGSVVVMVLLAITLVKLASEIVTLTECTNLLFFFAILLIITISFIVQKNKVQFIMRTMGKGFHDYENTVDNETLILIRKALDDSKKQKQFFGKAFRHCIFFTYSIIIILRPTMRFIRKDYLMGEPDDGILRVTPAVLWVPGDKFSLWINVSMLLFQVFMGTLACLNVIAHHLFFLSVCEESATQCYIVGLTMKHVGRRAASLSGPMVPALRRCMAHSIRHYHTVCRVIYDLEDVVRYSAFVFIGGTAFMICLSGFLFISDVPAVVKLGGAMFMISAMLGGFVYCFYGEQVKTMSEDIHDQFYRGDWIENMTILKNYMLIMQSKTKNGLQIRAGGYLPLNLNTFSNLKKAAYEQGRNVLN